MALPNIPRVAKGIRAYHGSPHKFEQFDISKMGTGEGAQAFGYGLYFAQSEDVARAYRQNLSAGKIFKELSKDLDPDYDAVTVDEMLEEGVFKGDEERLLRALQEADYLGYDRPYRAVGAVFDRDSLDNFDTADPAVQKLKEVRDSIGSMFEVDLNINPDDILDWNAPVYQQSESIRRKLADAGVYDYEGGERLRALEAEEAELRSQLMDESQTFSRKSLRRLEEVEDQITDIKRNYESVLIEGRDAYQNAIKAKKGRTLEEQIADIEAWRGSPEEEAAAKMRDLGIQAIRYADAFSRGDNARGATSNFVVFDDRVIEISRRYGIALPLAGAVLAGTMTPQEAIAAMPNPLSETDQKLRQLALKGLERDSSQETVDALNNVLARQGKSLAALGIDVTPEPVPEPAAEPAPREPVPTVTVRELRRTPDRPTAPAQAPEVQRDTPETQVQNLEVRQVLADIQNEISIPEPELSTPVPDTLSDPEPTTNGGIIHPENKKFFENFHNRVISESRELVEDGKTTTMRILGVGIEGKEYLIPSYDPDTKRVLSMEEAVEKYKPLIQEGKLKGYDTPQEAEADRRMFYPEIVGKVAVSDTPPEPLPPEPRVSVRELRRTPDRPAAPGEPPAVPMDRPVVDTIVQAAEDIIDPYNLPEDPTIDPVPMVVEMPPTDTEITNVATLETMGRLAEGQDAGIANTYEQAKADAEYNSDALKAKFTEYLTTFNRQTTEAVVGEADPEIVADKIQEDAEIEQSVIAPYMGAVVRAYPNSPKGIQEKTAARYYAMDLLAEYMKDYNGWDMAGDIVVSMIPGVALTDIIQSGVKPEMVEAVKQLSAEDQARFYTALLTQLNEAYDADKTFVAATFEAFLSPDGENTLAISQNLEKIFAGIDATAIFTGAAKMARGMKVVRDAKRAGNTDLADTTVATGIKDVEGKVAEALGVTREELVQAGLPFRNDTVEGMDHIPNAPGALNKLAPVDRQQLQNIRDAGVEVLTRELTLSPQLLKQGEVAGAVERITKETEKQLAEAYEGTAFDVGSIRVTKKQGEDVFVVTADILGPVNIRTGKLGEDEFEALVETLDIPAAQKKALLREFEEGGDPQEIIDDFVGNKAVVTQGIQDFRTARTTTRGTVRTETIEAKPSLDDYGAYELRQTTVVERAALSPVEKFDRVMTAGAELIASTQERVAAQLAGVYKAALAPVSRLRDTFARKRVEQAYELWERANKVEYDAAGNIIKSGQNVRPTPSQLAYEGIVGPDGKKIYLKSAAERQAFYNIAELADLFYLIGNKIDLDRARALGLKQIAINEGLRGAPRTTAAQINTTLDNMDEGATVFDVVGKRAVTKTEARALLEDQDKVLVALNDVMRTENGMHSVVIVPRNAVSELGPYQRARRNLYSPKINLGVRGVVMEVREGALNGVLKAATDPTNPHRKAVRFASGVKEGEKIAEELNQQAAEGVRYIFQEDTVEPLSGELRKYNSSGLFRGARSSDELRIGVDEAQVETVPVYQALARNMQHLSNQYPLNEWRMAQQQRFIKTVNAKRGDAPSITSFDDAIPEGHPMKAELEDLRNYLRQQFRVPSENEARWESFMLRLVDWMEGKTPAALNQTVMRLKDTNPAAKLRGATFHTLLGFFNPAQLWMQAQSASIAVSMYPEFAAKGLPRAFALRAGLYADTETLRSLAKRMNLNVDDYIATVEAFRRTGLHQSVRNNADFDAAVSGYTVSGAGVKKFLDTGLVFFRQGEIAARVFAWEIATQRYLATAKQTVTKRSVLSAKNKETIIETTKTKSISDFTDDDWREIFKQQQNLTLNMSRANRAQYQEGITGVATQFWQVMTKYMEAMVPGLKGRGFTTEERVRMMVGQVALYGAVGFPFGRYIVDTAAGMFNVEQDQVEDWMIVAAWQGLTGFLTNGEVDLSARSAIAAGVEDMIKGLFEEEVAPIEILLGASMSTLERGAEFIQYIEPLLFNRDLEINTVDVAALIGEGLLDIPSSTRNAKQAYAMAKYQVYLDRRYNTLFTDPTFAETAGKFAGFTPTRATIAYEIFEDTTQREEYLSGKADLVYKQYKELLQARGLVGDNLDVDKANKLLQAIYINLDVEGRDAYEIRERVANKIFNPTNREEQIILDAFRNTYRGDSFMNEAMLNRIIQERQ